MSMLALALLGGLLSPVQPEVASLQHSRLHLLAQADQLPELSPVQFQVEELEARIQEANGRARAIKTSVPTGYVVLTYFGGGIVFIDLVFGLTGAFATTATIALFFTLIGLGVAAVVIGLVVGFGVAESATLERDRIVKERMDYERQLKELRAEPPPQVQREAAPRLITLARF